MQSLGKNTDVATENVVSVSKEQNVAQRLNSKHKFIPIGCTENNDHKGNIFSRRNVEKSPNLLIMIMDDRRRFKKRRSKTELWKG